MSQRILVTGGAGFIGSHLIEALHREDPAHSIWSLDNLHPQVHGDHATMPPSRERFFFCEADVTDRPSLFRVVKEAQPHVVYHLAAETGTGQSYQEVSRYCHVNVTGTANLIEAIRQESYSSTKQVILTASRAVYGEGGFCDIDGKEFLGLPRIPAVMAQGTFSVPLPREARLPAHPIPCHASLPPSPTSVYASTKLMQEFLLRQAGVGASWRSTIVRLQNVYGPGQSLRNPYTGVLSVFAQRLLSNQPIHIFEDGMITRDFVFVEDVADALLSVKNTELPHGMILDIGTGQSVTILAVAALLMSYLGRVQDMCTITGEFRVGDIRHACADIRAAREHLQWTPRITLEAGLSRFADWARMELSPSQTV